MFSTAAILEGIQLCCSIAVEQVLHTENTNVNYTRHLNQSNITRPAEKNNDFNGLIAVAKDLSKFAPIRVFA